MACLQADVINQAKEKQLTNVISMTIREPTTYEFEKINRRENAKREIEMLLELYEE
jgi:hypothetical protein